MDAFALGAKDAEEFHGVFVGVTEPVREVGVEFGDFALGEDEVLVAEDDTQAAAQDVQPVVALV
ncbi:hypothetical protein BJ982_005255 [Sphaerisporangium siamense]|uniref:Uncharacterized protein n=1 Tax=Sphaerisporangium siamense TaxID=795645 RepID=A0A7W7DBT4_9ACTN|nr:hypothetical protein [Sphaerisporangium siamense]